MPATEDAGQACRQAVRAKIGVRAGVKQLRVATNASFEETPARGRGFFVKAGSSRVYFALALQPGSRKLAMRVCQPAALEAWPSIV